MTLNIRGKRCVEFKISGARIAREEGFPAIAAAFESFAREEKAHEERFKALLKSL